MQNMQQLNENNELFRAYDKSTFIETNVSFGKI
jgi:hypothetical protein